MTVVIYPSMEGSKRSNRSYSSSFKLKVVNYALKYSKIAASREFKVCKREVQEWCQQRDQLASLEAKRLKGGSPKSKYEHIEQDLLKWVEEQTSVGVLVTGRDLKIEALRIHNQKGGGKSFKPRDHWLMMFIKRAKLITHSMYIFPVTPFLAHLALL